jgi:hypothetical protein
MPDVTADSAIKDDHGNYWLKSGFKQGTIYNVLMVRNGMLTPFDDRYQPAGDPIAIDKITHGTHRNWSSVRVHRMGMDFGLDDLNFAVTYSRNGDSVSLDSRMDAVPKIVAPPGVHQMVMMVANDFMRTLAQGNGGLLATARSDDEAGGNHRFRGGFTAEFRYSPALELLARIGDAIADANNPKVRADERKLGEELFDAFLKDYNDARPKILALDRNGASKQGK